MHCFIILAQMLKIDRQICIIYCRHRVEFNGTFEMVSSYVKALPLEMTDTKYIVNIRTFIIMLTTGFKCIDSIIEPSQITQTAPFI